MKNNVEKIISIAMWVVVALTVIIFFASIMLGHSTNFNFLFGLEDVSNVTNNIAQNVSTIG